MGVAGSQFIAVCFFVAIVAAAACVYGLKRHSPWQLILLYLIICIGAMAAGAWGLRVRWSPEVSVVAGYPTA
jgi:hypothetical protein